MDSSIGKMDISLQMDNFSGKHLLSGANWVDVAVTSSLSRCFHTAACSWWRSGHSWKSGRFDKSAFRGFGSVSCSRPAALSAETELAEQG